MTIVPETFYFPIFSCVQRAFTCAQVNDVAHWPLVDF